MRIFLKIGIVITFLFTAYSLKGLHPAFTADINVSPPSTIQSGINAAADGDTVLVAPGTYNECIDFLGKSITVKSSDGASVTIINGSLCGSVVTFYYNDRRNILDGFTIQNGTGTLREDGKTYGGGIYCFGSSPEIINNVIKGNSAYAGGGILCESYYFYEASPSIFNNTIVSNVGGGIYCKEDEFYIGGVPTIVNNIIVNNTASPDSGSFGGGIYASEEFTPIADDNDIWNNSGLPYDGDGWDMGGEKGKNIKNDPLFVDAAGGDYHLQSTSPCINAGTGTKEGAPNHDFEGETRPSGLEVDIGADEFVGTSPNTCSCEGATGCISGRVTRQSTGLPIQGKTVIFKRKKYPKQTTTTNASGCYSSPTLENGTYTVKVKGCKVGGSETVVISDTNKTVDGIDFQCR